MPYARIVSALAIAATLSSLPRPALAAWSNSPNLNTPVANTSADEIGGFTVADGAGGVFVAWTTGPSGAYDIAAQHFDSQGNPTWGPNGVVVSNAANNQALSPIVSDGAGGVVVVWHDFRSGTNYDIYGQRLNAAGVRQWAANGIPLIVAANNQFINDYVSDGAGGMIVTWYDGRSGNDDIYAQRVTNAGSVLWGATGVPVCVQPNGQTLPVLAPDGQGGVIISWIDGRSGTEDDILAQRLNAAGVPQWFANGVNVCNATGSPQDVVIAPDQGGGAYIAWVDTRLAEPHIYAQHLAPPGNPLWAFNGMPVDQPGIGGRNSRIVADGTGGCIIGWDSHNGFDFDVFAQRLTGGGGTVWTPGGTIVCNGAGSQEMYGGWIVSDGQSGAIFTWVDDRGGVSMDLYSQRLSGAGTQLWPASGVALCTAAGDQGYGRGIADGANGYLMVFGDTRQVTNQDVYIQRIERFGQLGSPEPRIASVRDVLNDQGGQVRVAWNASYLDAGPGSTVDEYRLWRRVPTSAALARIRRGEALRAIPDGVTNTFWEYVSTQTANGFPSYSAVTSTEGDSVASSNPRTVFMVEARQSMTGQHWDSPADSGYSVDNLPPSATAPFAGTFANGTASLDWGANPASDLANYRLYRGTTSGFVPGPGNLIASPTHTSYVDPAGALYWYKLSAVDVHGNEGPFVTALPSGTVGVETAGLPRELRLAPPAPNPTRAGAAFRLALPEDAHVRAAIFDQQGRTVRALCDGTLPAGEHDVRWDGRNAGGSRVGSGVYFYRFVVNGRTLDGRLTIVR